MPSVDYIPASDADRIVWFNNFASKFAVRAGTLGFSEDDIDAVNTDKATFAYLVNAVEAFKTESKERVNYKKIMATVESVCRRRPCRSRPS